MPDFNVDLIVWNLPISTYQWINNYLNNKVGIYSGLYQDKTIYV